MVVPTLTEDASSYGGFLPLPMAHPQQISLVAPTAYIMTPPTHLFAVGSQIITFMTKVMSGYGQIGCSQFDIVASAIYYGRVIVHGPAYIVSCFCSLTIRFPILQYMLCPLVKNINAGTNWTFCFIYFFIAGVSVQYAENLCSLPTTDNCYPNCYQALDARRSEVKKEQILIELTPCRMRFVANDRGYVTFEMSQRSSFHWVHWIFEQCPQWAY